MTTLTAGQSASLTIDAGQSLSIVSSSNNEGSVTLAPTVPADVSDAGNFPIGPPAMTKTFGPYASPVAATVACTVGSIAYTLAGNPLVRAVTDAVTGISSLSAGGASIRNLQKYFPLWSEFSLSATPTIYFDPDAAGTNAGTLANPYNSVTTLAAVMTGNKAGTVLGIKRGTTTTLTKTLVFSGIYGTYNAPVAIVPYGDTTLAPPIISGLRTLTGWADTGVGGVWSKDITTEIGTLSHPACWESGARLWGQTDLATLQAGGTGYYWYDSGPKVLYIKPAASPNTSAVVQIAAVDTVLDISYGDVADTGHITISGIEFKGAGGYAALRIAPSGIGSITAASNIVVSGVKLGMVGRDINSGTNDGLLFNGPSDTTRFSGAVVRGAYIYDCLNNAVEANGHSGAVVEYIESHDCCGKVVEYYASVSSSVMRYCRGYNHTEAKLKTLATSSCGFWIAGFKLTSGVGNGTNSADTTVSLSNRFNHNLFDGIKSNGLLLDAGSGHLVHHNTWACPSTSVASYIRFNSGLTGCEFSNNLVILRAAVPAVWRRTGVTGLTGDGNAYVFQSAVTNKFYSDNATPQTTIAAWRVATSIDTNSKIIGLPVIGSDVANELVHAVKGVGVTGLGYIRDQMGVAIDYPPSVGALEQ